MAGAGGPRRPLPIGEAGLMNPILGATGIPGGYSEALRFQPDWFYGDAVVNEGLYTQPRETVSFSAAKPLEELFSNNAEISKAEAEISKKYYIYSKLLNSFTEAVRKNYIEYLIVKYIEAKKTTYGSLSFSLDELTPEEIQKKVTYDLCKVGNISDITNNVLLMSVDSSQLALDGRMSDNEQYYNKEKELKFIKSFIKKASKKCTDNSWLDTISTQACHDINHYYSHLSKNVYHNINIYNVFLGKLNNQEFDVTTVPMIDGMLPDSTDEAELKKLAILTQDNQRTRQVNNQSYDSDNNISNDVSENDSINDNDEDELDNSLPSNDAEVATDDQYVDLDSFLDDDSVNTIENESNHNEDNNTNQEPKIIPIEEDNTNENEYDNTVEVEHRNLVQNNNNRVTGVTARLDEDTNSISIHSDIEELNSWRDLITDYLNSQENMKHTSFVQPSNERHDEELIDMLSNIEEDEVDFSSMKGLGK